MLYKYQTVILVFSVIVTVETEDLHDFLGLNIPIFNNHAGRKELFWIHFHLLTMCATAGTAVDINF